MPSDCKLYSVLANTTCAWKHFIGAGLHPYGRFGIFSLLLNTPLWLFPWNLERYDPIFSIHFMLCTHWRLAIYMYINGVQYIFIHGQWTGTWSYISPNMLYKPHTHIYVCVCFLCAHATPSGIYLYTCHTLPHCQNYFIVFIPPPTPQYLEVCIHNERCTRMATTVEAGFYVVQNYPANGYKFLAVSGGLPSTGDRYQ